MKYPSQFWDALAPQHAAIEDNYLDRESVRRILQEIESPVLVVGAGQGLIVEELQRKGFQCDGVDLSSEMVKYAKLRRGTTLVHADAKAMPFAERTYGAVIYATGVIDFTGDEEAIRMMLKEGRRVVKDAGKIFVAFYRVSAVLESFMSRVGLLSNSEIALRQSLELYLLNPAQMIKWVAKRAGLGYFHAVTVMLRMSALCTRQERRMTFKMQQVFREMSDPRALINAAPEKQPYRNEGEIRNLFKGLGTPVKQLRAFRSCYMVEI
jgi:ubiquinone/menaquinone biosynthesis C-methylase UbiE